MRLRHLIIPEGNGSEIALAYDMSFASREKASLPPGVEIAAGWDACMTWMPA